jgi:cytochrome c-type biogenesis protein CcmH
VTVFIIIAAVLTAVAVLLAAWPLFRPRTDEGGKPVKPSRQAAGALALFVPFLAFVTYFNVSDWRWDERAAATHARDGDSQAASLQQVAEQLEARLQRNQGDAEGWKMLGRTYVVMGSFDQALGAYQKAFTLTSGQDMEALLGYAEAKVLVDESAFEGEAGQLFERAVTAEPNNPKALWYAGLTAFRKQDLPTARARWSALRQLGGPDEILQIVDQRIAEIDQQIGAAPTAAVTPPPVSAATPEPAGAEAPAPEGGIPLRIELAPQLAGRVPPGTTLYILARSAAGGAPLAAVRRSADELPLDVTLTDGNAMVPGTSLTQVDSLSLVARVSFTGRPIASTGDLFGEVRYDPSAKGRIKLTIDQVVE